MFCFLSLSPYGYRLSWASQVVLVVKNLPQCRRPKGRWFDPWVEGRGGHGSQLQYSCLENLMDRGAWWAIVHGVPKSQT